MLRNGVTPGPPDATFAFGMAGDLPVVGDWDGNGTSTIGLFRPTQGMFYLRNTNATGDPDAAVKMGRVDDRPVAGDWDANGDVATLGLFRLLRRRVPCAANAGGAEVKVPFGAESDLPVAATGTK